MFGRGNVLFGLLEEGPWWPRWPRLAMGEAISEKIRVGKELERAYPLSPVPHPAIAIERHKDDRGFNYCVRFRDNVWFAPDPTSPINPRQTTWFNCNKELREGDALEAAWEYFQEVNRRYAKDHRSDEWSELPDGFGPFEDLDKEKGLHFHGAPESHIFWVVKRPWGDGVAPSSKMLWVHWDAARYTTVAAERFCGNCRPHG